MIMKNNLDRIRFISLTGPCNCPCSKAVRTGTQAGRSLQAGTDAKDKEGAVYRLGSHGFMVRLLIESRITCPGVAQPIISGPFPINH